MNKNIRFKGHKTNTKYFDYPFLILSSSLIILIYFVATETTFENNPSIYLVAFILAIRAIVLMFIRENSKKVISIEFKESDISIEFIRNGVIAISTFPIKRMDIELFELKDHKSFFEGLQLNLIYKSKREKFKILYEIWNYKDFENIYSEFKQRKNEKIPADNEKDPFKQLQIMNNTYYKGN